MPSHASTHTSATPGDASAQAEREAPRGRKRLSTDNESSDTSSRGKKARKSEPTEEALVADEERKPRLTTPDLEFDYDRSQLRDPRLTPGRVRRPRRQGSAEVSEEFKQQFYIPKPETPMGRLSSIQKDELDKKETLLDPSNYFHDLHVCHKKGRNGSPTYDSGGFPLDWNKVDQWMKPQAYSRSRAVKGMGRALAKGQSERDQMFNIFFADDKRPGGFESSNVANYMKDQVSKDLGVPWHQIGPKHFVEWEQKGFPKQTLDDWWKPPNEEERKRMSKMMTGASLRQDA
ncbi:hypothetical protein F5B20DRAFT_345164 [Whalleya microplaca]|nr:hypothetical protein F5B20DRAFT_345164 [Whalleya microplaca]